ncbi:probable polygalacturonase [Papaver somniferum]|nr:probable polygalacturonase [Papaver somniferum]
MKLMRSTQRAQVLFVLLGLVSLLLRGAESFDYTAINCRKHTASLKDFGGVGDGKTSNTKAFRSAVASLSKFQNDGGSQLFVPPGRWLTGSFNLTSHFTLYLHKDAVILASQDLSEWPIIGPLPSYGRGKDLPGGRYISLIFGMQLTDVIITGDMGTIDGQGAWWWQRYKTVLKSNRPYLIEIMNSDQVQITNLKLIDSPSWHIHPVYSSNIFIKGITIVAPPASPNTDGINPDSCTNVRIEDCNIVSGDDCVSVKSGWDQYGIAFGKPTKHVIIRRLTCTSPNNAVLTIGSEMSGGIQDVRLEDIVAIRTESAVRMKTTLGRGGYVKDVFIRRMTMKTMRWAFLMTGNYSTHPNNNYNRKALPVIDGISFSDMVGNNVKIAGQLDGIKGNPFTGICISNVTLSMLPTSKFAPWTCSDIKGLTSGVSPKPCGMLTAQVAKRCPFPTDILPIDRIQLKKCSIIAKL